MLPAPPKFPPHPPVQQVRSKTGTPNKTKVTLIPDPPDGGYGWVIVFVAFCSYGLSMVTMANFGVFLVELVEHFQMKKVVLGWIGALQISCHGLVGLILGPLVKRYGCRIVCIVGSLLVALCYVITFIGLSLPFMFVTFGALPGAGIGCLFMTSNVSVQTYFSKRRSLAFSVAVTGTAVGMFTFPQLTRLLIDSFAWQGAILVYGGLMLNGIILGLLMRPAPTKTLIEPTDTVCSAVKSTAGSSIIFTSTEMIATENALSQEKDTEAEQSIQQCTCLSRYTTFCRIKNHLPEIFVIAGYFLLHCGHQSFIALQPIRAAHLGFSKTQGAFLISMYGIISGVFRIPVGWLGDRRCVSRVVLCGIGGIFAGICTICSTILVDYNLLLAYSSLYGLGIALYFGLLSVAVIDVFGISRIQLGASLQQTIGGLAVLFMLPLSGWMIDVTENPNIALFVFAICQCLGGTVLTLIPFIQKLQKSKNQKERNMLLGEEGNTIITKETSNFNNKSKELSVYIENGRLSVPKLSR